MDKVNAFLSGREVLTAGSVALVLLVPVLNVLFPRLIGPPLALLGRPFSWVSRFAYRKLAPRNPFNLAVRSYGRHFERAFAHIDPPVGPKVRIPFSRAYVPLRLLSSEESEPVDLFSFVAAHRRCVVLGAPGTGKTTLVTGMTLAILGHRAPGFAGSLPVLVSLRRMASEHISVEAAIVATLNDYNFPNAGAFVRAAFLEGKLFVALDGLDEVDSEREFVTTKILEFCRQDAGLESPNAIVVTCREGSYKDEELRDVVPDVARVEPFSNGHMRDFLRAWPVHHGRSVVGLFAQVSQDAQIRDICRNPLHLTLLAGLYLEEGDFEMPPSRGAFYEVVLTELLRRRYARKGIRPKFGEADKQAVLQRVAISLLLGSEERSDPEAISRDQLLTAGRAVLEKDDRPDALVEELLRDGLLRPVGRNSFTFAHRTFQEYLAAYEAHRTLETEEVLARTEGRGHLSQVLAFYCGLLRKVPEVEGVVRHLAAGGDWQAAGRAILYCPEVVASPLVEEVVGHLRRRVETSPVALSRLDLELLGSMAQRRGGAFDPARAAFDSTVDSLVAGATGLGAAAIASALAASPDGVFRAAPALLASHQPAYRRAAVRLLLAVDTDESLDQVVHCLAHADPVVRQEAAACISGIATTRRDELWRRQHLLPVRPEAELAWPFDRQFPATIAVAVAENTPLDPADPSPFQHAARALSEAARVAAESPEFLKSWRRLRRDLTVSDWFARASERYRWGVRAAVISLWVLSVAGGWGSYLAGQVVDVGYSRGIAVMPRAPLDAARALATDVLLRLAERHPPRPASNPLVNAKRWILRVIGRPSSGLPSVPDHLHDGVVFLHWLSRGYPGGLIPEEERQVLAVFEYAGRRDEGVANLVTVTRKSMSRAALGLSFKREVDRTMEGLGALWLLLGLHILPMLYARGFLQMPRFSEAASSLEVRARWLTGTSEWTSLMLLFTFPFIVPSSMVSPAAVAVLVTDLAVRIIRRLTRNPYASLVESFVPHDGVQP